MLRPEIETNHDAPVLPIYAAPAQDQAEATAATPPPEAPASKPISDARIEANRRNAQKSTGPKSAEGKARSSRNALKHGLTAEKHVVAPAEDPDEYRRQLDGWLAETQAQGHMEGSLVGLAFDAMWKLRRGSRQEAAGLTLEARRAADAYDAMMHRKAVEQGERLLFEPIDRCAAATDLNDPKTMERIARREKDDSAILAFEMETYAQGIRWKLDRWLELVPMLNEEGFLHYDMRYRALRLMGKRPEDVMHDPVVSRWLLLCNALHPQAWEVWDDAFQGILTDASRGAYFLRVALMAEAKPDADKAWTELAGLIQAEHDRLQAKLAALTPRADAERAEAAERALFSSGPEAMLRLRYATQNQRVLHKTLDQLIQLRKSAMIVAVEPEIEEPEPVVEPPAAPEPSMPEPEIPAPAPVPPSPPTPSRRPRRPRNEPNVERRPGVSERVRPHRKGAPQSPPPGA